MRSTNLPQLPTRAGRKFFSRPTHVVLTCSQGAEVHLRPRENSHLKKNLSGRDASLRRPFQWVNCIHYVLSITGYTMQYLQRLNDTHTPAMRAGAGHVQGDGT